MVRAAQGRERTRENRRARRRKKRLTAYDLYQLFVGEIGISRHEFLYEIEFWEARRIIDGYRARHHAGWEQARLVAYNAHYCMGSKDPVPVVTQWIKFPWEKEPAPPLTDEERSELQAEMDAINKAAAEGHD